MLKPTFYSFHAYFCNINFAIKSTKHVHIYARMYVLCNRNKFSLFKYVISKLNNGEI